MTVSISVWVDSPARGRWAVLVGGGALVRCRTLTEARRLRAGNHPDSPTVVRRVTPTRNFLRSSVALRIHSAPRGSRNVA